MTAYRRLSPLIPVALLLGCHLVDRRTFDPTLRGEIKLAAAPSPAPVPASGPPPLLTIRLKPGVGYEEQLRLAVQEALRRRPDVQFDVVTAEPAVGTDAEQVAALAHDSGEARDVASAILRDGVDPGQVQLGAEFDRGLPRHEVRVYVR